MRKLLTLIIFFALALGGVAGAYQIQKGDTLSSIAKRFDTSVDELVALNDIQDENVIYSGDFIETEGLLFGATPTPTSSAPRIYVESPDWQLFNGAAAGDTTLTLDDLEDIYGNEVAMSSSSKMYGRINPDGVTESISFTGITTNGDGTKTLTGVKSVLGQYPYTETSGLVRSHSIGALFRLTNTAGFYNDFANKENNEIVEGQWTFNQIPLAVTSTPTDQRSLITLYQFQQATTTGGINGSETAKGVFEGATQAEMAAGTEFGSTGASLVLLSKYASSTRLGTGFRIVSTAAGGYVSSTFGGVAFSMATLNSSALVVENPASASVTAGTSTIPITSSVTSTLSGSYFGTTTPGSVFYVGSDGFAKSLTMTTSGYSLRTNSSVTAPTWFDGGMDLGASNEGTLFSYPLTMASSAWSLTDDTFADLGGYANIESTGATWNAQVNLIGTGSGSELTWDNNKAITVEFMARATNGTAGSRRMGLGSGEFDTVSSSATAAVALFSISSSTLFATASPGDSNITYSQISGVTVTNWNLYKIIWTPATSAKFYVNGVLKATISTTLPTTGSSNFGIGGTTNGEDLLLGQVVVTQGI